MTLTLTLSNPNPNPNPNPHSNPDSSPDPSPSPNRNRCEAASRGDVARLERLISADGGNDVNLGDYDRRTPLHLAAAEGFLGVTTFLIERAGAQHSPLDRWHGSPLQVSG